MPIKLSIILKYIQINKDNPVKQIPILQGVDNGALIQTCDLQSKYLYIYKQNDTKLIRPKNNPKNFIQPIG